MAAIFLTAGALLLTSSPAHAQGVWTAVPSLNEPGNNYLYGADASDASHVWAVGKLYPRSGGSRSILLRHDGTAWQPAPRSGFPSNDGLYDVEAVSSDEAWAAGNSLLPNTESTLLYAVEALTPSNVWVVGETYTSGSGRQPYVAQFDGTSWHRIATPTINDGRLTDIVALSPSNIVAVGAISNGYESIILHWDGSSWVREAAPYGKLTGAAAVGPSTFWAVGTRFGPDAYEERTFTMVRT